MKKYLAVLSLLSALLFFMPFNASAAIVYTTWDPSNKGANVDLTGNNLIATKNNAGWQSIRSVLGVSTGKWYWEMTLANGFLDSGSPIVGVGNGSGLVSNDFSVNANGWGATNDTGTSGGAIKKRTNNANSAYAANAFGNSTIGVYYDADAGNLGFIAADGTNLGNAYTGLTAGAYYAYAANYSNTSSWTANFGGSAFVHSVPSGYNAGLYSTTSDSVTGTGTANRLTKFTASTTIGDSLFSDDGSNTTLTAGNLFMQIGSLIDTISGGALNFGTTNATSITIGKTGITTTFPGPLTVNGPATFGNNITVPAAYSIDTSTAGTLNIGTSTTTAITIGKSGVTATIPGTISWGKASTTTSCNSSASPAVCSAASAGSVAMATGGSTLVVNTTAVTVNSQIFVTEDSSLGTRLGITCNTTTGRVYSINARTAGTSFTIKSSANPAANKACLSYWIIN